MSGAQTNTCISSLVNEAGSFTVAQKQALIKSFRAATGQMKVIGPLSVASSTVFVAEPEFAFPVKAGQRYLIEGSFMISSAAAGGAKLQLNAPANTSGNSVLTGKVIGAGTTASGTTIGTTTGAATSTLNATSLYANAAVTDAIYVQVFIQPAVDDLITFSFAQNTSNATASILLQGSLVSILGISSSVRKSPNGI